MSEYPASKPSLTNFLINDDDTQAESAPSSAIQDDGFGPSTTKYLTYQLANFLWHKVTDVAAWVMGMTRQFTTIEDLIDGLSTHDLGRVRANLAQAWEEESRQTLSGGSTKLTNWCSDGYRIYAVIGSNLVAYALDDLETELWSVTPATGETLEQVCTDGAYVYCVYSNATKTEMFQRAVADGAAVANIVVTTSDIGACRALVTDGKYIYGAWQNDVYYEDIDTFSTLSTWTPGSATNIYDLHCAAGRLFVTTNEPQVYCTNHAGSVYWSLTIDSMATTDRIFVCADDKRVYVLQNAHDTSGYALSKYLSALSIQSGEFIWGTDDAGAATTAAKISHDGRFVWVSNAWDVYGFDKLTGDKIAKYEDRTHPLPTGLAVYLNVEDTSDTSENAHEVPLPHTVETYRKIDSKDTNRPIMGWLIAPEVK